MSLKCEHQNKKVAALESKLALSKFKLEDQQKRVIKQTEIRDINRKKFDGICIVDTFEEFLEEKEKELNNLRDEKSKKSCQEPAIDKHVETIMQCDMCPVCENDLSSEWISKKTDQKVNKLSLIESLKKNTVNRIEEVKQLSAKIRSAEQKCVELRKLRSSYEAIKNCTNDILSIKSVLPSYLEQVSTLEEDIKKERNILVDVKKKYELLREHTRDVSNCESLEKKLANDKKLDPSKWSNDAHLEKINSILKSLLINFQSTDENFPELQETYKQTKTMYSQQLSETLQGIV